MLKPSVVHDRLYRARQAVGKKTPYRLGRGGYYKWSVGFSSDCSGFASWLLMLRREPKASRPYWLETSAIWRDATGKQSVFVKLPKPEVGCLAVYPDALLGLKQGHIGLITAVGIDGSLIGIDCANGSWKKHGDAILEHRLTYFETNPKTVFVALRQDLL